MVCNGETMTEGAGIRLMISSRLELTIAAKTAYKLTDSLQNHGDI